MQFDASLVPASRAGLPPHIAAMMDGAFYARRSQGLNVQFIRETDGLRDEFSFGDVARRDAFISSLISKDIPFAISE